jgi:alanine-glyoxylate transaminase/serine-glyoxylate transaminase/serine-pyruvate transaminase
VDDAAVRQQLLREFSIEIGGGLGPLAGKIWRIGLMGASSERGLIVLLLGALEQVLRAAGHRPPADGGAVAAALDTLEDVAAGL